MKVIIAGSRGITDYQLVRFIIETSPLKDRITEVVCGMAAGVDSLGARWAWWNGVPIKEFPAEWATGRAAGFRRNRQMAEYADAAIIVWDGRSKGAGNMIDIMNEVGKPYYLASLKMMGQCGTTWFDGKGGGTGSLLPMERVELWLTSNPEGDTRVRRGVPTGVDETPDDGTSLYPKET